MSVREAARKTLALRGVRLAFETTMHGPGDERKVFRQGEGVADLAGRRTDVTVTVGPAILEPMAQFAHRLTEKHPWVLRDDELRELDAGLGGVTSRDIYVGGAVFMSHPYSQKWFHNDGDTTSPRRRRNDPLWILEALMCADDARWLESEEVRGESCKRFGFHVDLRLHREELDTPQEWLVGPPHVAGEVWIDREQRVHRVDSREVARRRTRQSGRRATEADLSAYASTSLELWDYRTDVSIDIPHIEPPQSRTIDVLARLTARLWRRRRDYEPARRHTAE